MAISGSWADAVAVESGALKWGHGINPIHSIEGAGYGGRNYKPPHTGTGPDGPQTTALDPSIIDIGTQQEYNYTDEDFRAAVWGYGTQTGTSDRPGLGTSTERFRGVTTKGYPPYGPVAGGIPSGTKFRAQKHGETAKLRAKLGDKEETVGEGWENKIVGGVDDAGISDPKQYVMQTSMLQRDLVRRGSQNPNTGTASEFAAPIGSFRPTWGQRIKPWSGGRRHWDMFPRQQNQVVRPFWNRSAATGYTEWMQPNSQRLQEPLQRQPVPDPNAGDLVPSPGNVYQEESYPVADYVNVWY